MERVGATEFPFKKRVLVVFILICIDLSHMCIYVFMRMLQMLDVICICMRMCIYVSMCMLQMLDVICICVHMCIYCHVHARTSGCDLHHN